MTNEEMQKRRVAVCGGKNIEFSKSRGQRAVMNNRQQVIAEAD